MPFTFSHPAIILILRKWNRYLDFTGLVLGSMAPDFEYFLRFEPTGYIGHTFLGFLYFNIPICFVIGYLFHRIVKKPFLAMLPNPLDDWYSYMREIPFHLDTIKKVLKFIGSLLIGMFSHVLWDAFTHSTGFFVRNTLLKNSVCINYNIPIYKILQHGSTLIGGLIICIFLYKIRNPYGKNPYKVSYKIKISYHVVSLIIGLSVVFYRMYTLGGYKNFHIGSMVVSAIDGWLIGYFIMSCVIGYGLKKHIVKIN